MSKKPTNEAIDRLDEAIRFLADGDHDLVVRVAHNVAQMLEAPHKDLKSFQIALCVIAGEVASQTPDPEKTADAFRAGILEIAQVDRAEYAGALKPKMN